MITSGASKPNGGGVADVQLQDPVALGLEPCRVLVHGATDLVEDVLQLG